ncbi:MAG TPA: [Fe-Fe] hydrogenase large subunit C-terminal domain-containing protein [Syntrophorhabdaceae bacterium]|nr:4Fe-4S binding protein [Syntrophorhabdaceae bacterium]MDI9560296.1 [Fe-Fe] hydrogenase large subunit C-terminal domain-containing protein [Pseudomonadota bacterium]OQC48760.1 MAG: Sensor protein ZraS [Deltaproteobacteria bacterium ADurb.Bin026]MBP8697413.1 4Fe-4S binding protein [Syntrophorhabdaceae bacterium]HNZ59714.1 [Fe-Fe] hydrogenase large subunit C-terminal domain-containing protein [Syntrophorhabdaceae bacterium]
MIKQTDTKKNIFFDDGTFKITVNVSKCRKCSYCIQICPAKAIKLGKDSIKIFLERCIFCGSCITACPQHALGYESAIEKVKELLSENEKTVACIDPAFPAMHDIGSARQLVTALKSVGFKEVWEGAFGAELISQQYRKLLIDGTDKTLISSFCPVVVFYIQKYLTQLIPNIAPVVSPMIAIGRVARAIKGPDWRIVYITPCLAHIKEVAAPEVAGAIDDVITFRDVKQLFDSRGIQSNTLPETDFDGPRPFLGRVISIVGGLYRSTGAHFDILMDEITGTYGHRRVIGALKQLASGRIKAKFFDFVYCSGCVDGPFTDTELSVLGRRQLVIRYAKDEMSRQDVSKVIAELDSFEHIDLHRDFLNMEERLPTPTEEEIKDILKKIDKLPPNHNMDCRACGYLTCRDKAIAVAQGIAEAEYCLPYLLEQSKKIYQQLKKSHNQLKMSHQELEQAQAHLLRTEKLASIGQLSAGVAHEINNPLGTIMIYAHLLLKGMDKDDPRIEDIELIIGEANRAKEIVQGLLSFARETKLRQGLMNVSDLLEDVLSLVINQSLFHNIRIEKSFVQDMPIIVADETKLKQVFLNIILNAAQAMEGNGKLTISTIIDKKHIKVKIQDTGPGIPPENMGKLFSPFFTTKEKGTGLGLAISYGIVERHGGKIDVDSELGKGSTFIISLPISIDEEDEKFKRHLNKLSSQNKITGRKNYGQKN